MIKFLEHTADLKFVVRARTLPKTFEQCALAMKKAIVDNTKIASNKKKTIKVEGEDDKEKLYNFLEEILFILDSEGFILSKIKVKIIGKEVHAEIFGDKTSNYSGLNHIKSPTYAEMYIRRLKTQWEAQVVLDV